MNEIITQSTQLPDTIEDLTQFVLVSKAKLQAYMLKLQTVNKLSVAQEIRDQTLQEAQEVSTALIAAEQRIGELLLSIPKASGKRTDLETSGQRSTEVKTKAETISEMGYGEREAKDYQQMAKYPEVVKQVLEDAIAEGKVATKSAVMREISYHKEQAKREKQRINAEKKESEVKTKSVKKENHIEIQIPDDNYIAGPEDFELDRDGKRKCMYCRRMLPISMFKDKDYKFRCKDCKKIKAFPDSLNPVIPVVITDDITIGDFTNVIDNEERSLEFSLETGKDRMNENVRNSVKARIDKHIEYLKQFKDRL